MSEICNVLITIFVIYRFSVILLETKDTIPFDDTIQPICIPNLEFGIQVGETCTTGGWGRPGIYLVRLLI